MPIPKPRKGEKQSDFISRCMGNKVMVKEYPDQKQRAAVCHSQWRRKDKKKQEENMTRELYTLDAEHDGACEWITDGQGLLTLSDGEPEDKHYSATCVIGDRFYHGKFLAFKEVEMGHQTMNSAFHDLNHWSTNYPGGFFGVPNIEYVIGHQQNTRLESKTKKMISDVYIDDSAANAKTWHDFRRICEHAGRTPNVSVTFWASKKDVLARELPKGTDYASQGFNDDSVVPYLFDVEFVVLASVLQGACNDKDGCGIPIQQDEPIPIQQNEQIDKDQLIKKMEILKRKIEFYKK